jgi:hypothetical protein
MSFVEKRVLVRVVDTRQACDTRGPGNPHRDCFWPTGTILRPMEYRCGRWGVGMRGMVRSKNFSGAGPFLVLCEGQGRWRSCRRPSCLVVFLGAFPSTSPRKGGALAPPSPSHDPVASFLYFGNGPIFILLQVWPDWALPFVHALVWPKQWGQQHGQPLWRTWALSS